jgi:hypothetical protein
MKYAVEMGSGAMMYITGFINIVSGIQKLMRGGGGKFTHTASWSHKSIFIFLNKESKLIYKTQDVTNSLRNRDSSVDTATGWTTRVRLPAGQDFSLPHSVQTGSGAHPDSYSMGT